MERESRFSSWPYISDDGFAAIKQNRPSTEGCRAALHVRQLYGCRTAAARLAILGWPVNAAGMPRGCRKVSSGYSAASLEVFVVALPR